MSRNDELDAMTEADKEADILKNIKQHGVIRITSRQAMGFWGTAIDRLEEAGKVKSEMIENYEGQYSYLQVSLA